MFAENSSWEDRYMQTILEVNGQKMPERITATRQAISGRLHDLEHDSDHHAERQQIENALGALSVLETINLHAQGDSDVAQQIKRLQQDSRDAQMRTMSRGHSSIWLMDSRQGTVGSLGRRRTISSRICRTRRTSGRAATLAT